MLVTTFDEIEQACLTDVGVRRSHNQDSYATRLATDETQWQQQGHLFLVADGMGGHAVGEKASELAASIIPHTYSKYAHEGPATALRKAFLEANASIHACGEQNPEFRGMGTTSTALVLLPGEAWLGHVGDSRTYRIRNGKMEQLTYDHSYVWEYARLKHIDPEEVQDFPSNVIHRCLGPQPLVQVDIEGPYPLQDGDIFLLCSDGLSGQVTDNEMGVVASLLPPEEACRFLVDLANLRGGPDNISVVIVRVGSNKPGVHAPVAVRGRGLSFLWSWIPWPLVCLFGGTALAGAAIGMRLTWEDMASLSLLLFLVALVPILAGIIGLILHQRQRQARLLREDQRGKSQPYRSSPCQIDRALLDKLASAEKVLKQRVEERQWEPDGDTYGKHHALAEQCLKQGDLPGAFREYCRAMRPLNEALHRHRHKEEVFQPVWEKNQR